MSRYYIVGGMLWSFVHLYSVWWLIKPLEENWRKPQSCEPTVWYVRFAVCALNSRNANFQNLCLVFEEYDLIWNFPNTVFDFIDVSNKWLLTNSKLLDQQIFNYWIRKILHSRLFEIQLHIVNPWMNPGFCCQGINFHIFYLLLWKTTDLNLNSRLRWYWYWRSSRVGRVVCENNIFLPISMLS